MGIIFADPFQITCNPTCSKLVSTWKSNNFAFKLTSLSPEWRQAQLAILCSSWIGPFLNNRQQHVLVRPVQHSRNSYTAWGLPIIRVDRTPFVKYNVVNKMPLIISQREYNYVFLTNNLYSEVSPNRLVAGSTWHELTEKCSCFF
jgi:hypothetical protein